MRWSAVACAALCSCSSIEPSSIPSLENARSTILIVLSPDGTASGYALDEQRKPAIALARSEPPKQLFALLLAYSLEELQLAPGPITGRGRTLPRFLAAFSSSTDQTSWSAIDTLDERALAFELPSLNIPTCARDGRCLRDHVACAPCDIEPPQLDPATVDPPSPPSLENIPAPMSCPSDQAAIPGLGCRMIGTACPIDLFGPAPNIGFDEIRSVDSQTTIEAELAAAMPAGRLAILLSKGTHLLPSTITRSASLFGACAAETIIEANETVDITAGVSLELNNLHARSSFTGTGALRADNVVLDSTSLPMTATISAGLITAGTRAAGLLSLREVELRGALDVDQGRAELVHAAVEGITCDRGTLIARAIIARGGIDAVDCETTITGARSQRIFIENGRAELTELELDSGDTGRLTIAGTSTTAIRDLRLTANNRATIESLGKATLVLERAEIAANTLDLSTTTGALAISDLRAPRTLLRAGGEVLIERAQPDALTVTTDGTSTTIGDLTTRELFVQISSDSRLDLTELRAQSLSIEVGAAVNVAARSLILEGDAGVALRVECRRGSVCFPSVSIDDAELRGGSSAAMSIARIPVSFSDLRVVPHLTRAITGAIIEGGASVSLSRFTIEQPRTLGIDLQAGGTLYASDGTIAGTDIGIAIADPSYDLSRIASDVRFVDVAQPLDLMR